MVDGATTELPYFVEQEEYDHFLVKPVELPCYIIRIDIE